MNLETFKLPLANLLKRDLLDRHEVNLLWDNYLKIEFFWAQNFKNLKKIDLIILGESPLRDTSYIYNKDSADSSFLYKKHLLKCLELAGNNIHAYSRKTKMELMLELGILVIDLFPFSFTLKNNFNYRNKDKNNKILVKSNSEHQKILIDLFNSSYSWHLAEKIRQISKKTSNKTKYAFRYKACSKLDLKIFPKAPKISLGKGYDLDREIFYDIFRK